MGNAGRLQRRPAELIGACFAEFAISASLMLDDALHRLRSTP